MSSPVADARPSTPVDEHALAPLAADLAPTRTPTLSLVVPMYREAARIAATVAALASSPLHREDVEFVFVDDGSGDETSNVARSAIAASGLRHARVLVLDHNTGKGGAVRAGVLAAEGAHIGFVDADLSLDPAEVHRALARLVATRSDIVVGHRLVDVATQPKLRRIASLTFRSLAALVAPTGVRDTQCAMKLFRAPVARELFSALHTNGFAFDVEVLARARLAGHSVDEVAVAWEHQPGSRLHTGSASVAMLREVVAIRRLLGADQRRSSTTAVRSR